jgi:hypothetical protein
MKIHSACVSALICVATFLNLSAAWAQETVQRTYKLTFNITEKFDVLKADKKIRNGRYTATSNSGAIMAQGLYEQGKRIGHWTFYNYNGQVIQSYNYTNGKLAYTDNDDVKNALYYFTDTLRQNDTVRYPIKIGGYYYAISSMLNEQRAFTRNLREQFPNINIFNCRHTFKISPEGKLLKHLININVGNREVNYTAKDDYEEDFMKFIPAVVNGKPVACDMVVDNVVQVWTSTQAPPITRQAVVARPAGQRP